MKCEKCGRELNAISVDMFDYDGGDRFVDVAFREEDENAIVIDITQNWTGYETSKEEMPYAIRCPNCGRFPFENTEIQVYDVVRLVMFRKDSEADGDK